MYVYIYIYIYIYCFVYGLFCCCFLWPLSAENVSLTYVCARMNMSCVVAPMPRQIYRYRHVNGERLYLRQRTMIVMRDCWQLAPFPMSREVGHMSAQAHARS